MKENINSILYNEISFTKSGNTQKYEYHSNTRISKEIRLLAPILQLLSFSEICSTAYL